MVVFLPLELVSNILCYLPARSIARFRCVCKQWRSLSYDPDFVKEHQARAIRLGPLLFSQDSDLSPSIRVYELGDYPKVELCSLYPCSGDQIEYQISNSVNGLVCVSLFREDGHQHLLNPFSREVIKLPAQMSSSSTSSMFGLGIDSATGIYKLVRLFFEDNGLDRCRCHVLSLRPHQEWKYVRGPPCSLSLSRQFPVFLNGTLHWPAEHHIVAFNLTDHKFRLIPTPTAIRERVRLVLLESGGKLCLVDYPSRLNNFFLIWRLEDYATHIWTIQHKIDTSSVILPKTFCRSVIGIRGHEILLQVLQQRTVCQTSICSYDLHTKTLHVHHRNLGPSVLAFITESLVSPTSLIGDISN